MGAPDVKEQVKAEAARSLLERMAEKTKLVRFFRYNASAKHGVPVDDEKDITITPNNTQKQESVPAQNIVQIVKTDDDDDDRIARLERELEAERQLREQQERDNLLREQQERDRQAQPANTGNQESSPSTMSDKVKGILQTLAVLGGLGAAGYVGHAATNGDSKDGEPKVQAPYYSPYQYLEDTENHLP